MQSTDCHFGCKTESFLNSCGRARPEQDQRSISPGHPQPAKVAMAPMTSASLAVHLAFALLLTGTLAPNGAALQAAPATSVGEKSATWVDQQSGQLPALRKLLQTLPPGKLVTYLLNHRKFSSSYYSSLVKLSFSGLTCRVWFTNW